MARSIKYALEKVSLGKILDYGCGSGTFLTEILAVHPEHAVGFEPYMDERHTDHLPIYKTLAEASAHGPFGMITLFETLEHLEPEEIDQFLKECSDNLVDGGGVLVSAPIEIGPALILKEANRVFIRRNRPEYKLGEFVLAAFFGRPGRRAPNVKISHRGFDFRNTLQHIRSKGWQGTILGFGPLPVRSWYGNSQVYIWLTKSSG